jgi:hypothetical protein
MQEHRHGIVLGSRERGEDGNQRAHGGTVARPWKKPIRTPHLREDEATTPDSTFIRPRRRSRAAASPRSVASTGRDSGPSRGRTVNRHDRRDPAQAPTPRIQPS